MPDYNSVLTVKEVADLAAYIASLKGPESHEHAGHLRICILCSLRVAPSLSIASVFSGLSEL